MKKNYFIILILSFTLGIAQQVNYDKPLELLHTYTGLYNYTVTGGSLRPQNDTPYNPNYTTDLNSPQCLPLNTSDTVPLQDIPSGSRIVKAYLYWVGNGPTPDTIVDLQVNGESYTPVADRTTKTSFNSRPTTNFQHFSCVADVTAIVEQHGNADYTFGGLDILRNLEYCQAGLIVGGWAMVVVYNDENQTQQKRLNIYEGLDINQFSNTIFQMNNLNLPPNPEGKITGIFFEGDQWLGGTDEKMRFNGTNLAQDNFNPINNAYNGTRNYPQPSKEEWGVDIDTYDITPYISGGDTSAELNVSSARDLVLTNVIVMAVDTFIPEVSVTKKSDSNEAGTRVKQGDIIDYTIEIKNAETAQEAAYNIRVKDLLPQGVTYIGPTKRTYKKQSDNTYPKSKDGLTFIDTDNSYTNYPYSFENVGVQFLSFTDESPEIVDLKAQSIDLAISGYTRSCNDLKLIFSGPNGIIKTYNNGDITCRYYNGTYSSFTINETFTGSSVAGEAEGVYKLEWFDSNNTYSVDNYYISSDMNIDYTYKDIKERVDVNDEIDESIELFKTTENIDILPGEVFTIKMQVEVTDIDPFKKTNEVNLTAVNISDALSASVTDIMGECVKPAASGTPRTTQVGISTLNRNTEEWLTNDDQNKLGAYLVLESTKKGLAITQHANPSEVKAPVEGMIIWDSGEKCLKIYQSNGSGGAWSNCLQQSCNE